MRNHVRLLMIPAILLAAACNSSDAKLDDALSKDLALATQIQPYPPQQFMTPMEQAQYYGQAQQYQAMQRAGGYYQPQPVYQAPAPAPVRRTSTVSRSTGSSTTTARQPVRHTGRDAAIGAGAGAVIGVVTSKDKVKGGVVGAAAGAVLGAIVGHTIDVQH